MQYGLFLKGIGLTLEQALQFWRSEFTKGKVDMDKVMCFCVCVACWVTGRGDYEAVLAMLDVMLQPVHFGAFDLCPQAARR